MPKPTSHPSIWRPLVGRKAAKTSEQTARDYALARRRARISVLCERMRENGEMPHRVRCPDCGGQQPDIELCGTCDRVGNVAA